MFFIVMAIHQFLTENPKVTLLMCLFSIFVLFQSRWLINQYMKIESQFLNNLKGGAPNEAPAETTSSSPEEKNKE